MFDFVHEKKKLVQIVLALIILPFAFFGVDSYNKSTSGEALALVNGEKISQQEFDQAWRQQQNKMREMLGTGYDQAMFDRPEVKRSVLDNLVNQRLLTLQAQGAGLTRARTSLEFQPLHRSIGLAGRLELPVGPRLHSSGCQRSWAGPGLPQYWP